VSRHAIPMCLFMLRNSRPSFPVSTQKMLRLARRCRRTFFQSRNFASEASLHAYDGLFDLPHLACPLDLMFVF